MPQFNTNQISARTSWKIMKPGEKGRDIVHGKPPRINMVDLG